LIAALDWGLGHASRCIPVINHLLSNELDLILASDGRSLHLLEKEFPTLKCIKLPAYQVDYSSNNMVWNILKQGPKILNAVRREKKFLDELLIKEKITHIISDNRYGIYNKAIPSAFICHQLFPITPLQGLSNVVHEKMLFKFNEIWVPDFQGEKNLSGKLSHGKTKLQPKFIGPLSRFVKQTSEIKNDILIVLSGPEPQRSILEDKIKEALKNDTRKILLVQGLTNKMNKVSHEGPFEIHHFMNSDDLNKAMNESDLVICRAGYSSIMDLAKVQKKAILIPTPGQTEQIYLAKQLSDQNQVVVRSQDNLDLLSAIMEIENMDGIQIAFDNQNMEKVIHAFLEQ
jgi:uncharacterized protein (TIGR00661 family)